MLIKSLIISIILFIFYLDKDVIPVAIISISINPVFGSVAAYCVATLINLKASSKSYHLQKPIYYFLNKLRKSHFSQPLRNSDNRLQLSRRCCDNIPIYPQSSHINVGFN